MICFGTVGYGRRNMLGAWLGYLISEELALLGAVLCEVRSRCYGFLADNSLDQDALREIGGLGR